MDSLPLTRPAPWTEMPPNAGMEPLFDELAPLAASPVEVIVTVPEGKARRCIMHVVVAEGDAGQAFGVAFESIRDADDFEITARRFAGG